MKSVMHRLPTYASRCRPSLSVLKTTLEIVNQAGSSVPGLQAAVGTVLRIIEYAEAVRQNRKDAQELATSAAQIVEALLQATEDLITEEIDDMFWKDVVDFHNELLKISATLESLTKKALWHRALNRNGYAAAIAEHRRNLAHAVTLFQIKDGISSRRLMVRQHKELRDSVYLLSKSVTERFTPLPVFAPPTATPRSPSTTLDWNVPYYVREVTDIFAWTVEVDHADAQLSGDAKRRFFFFFSFLIKAFCDGDHDHDPFSGIWRKVTHDPPDLPASPA
ncbi:hypothetical protein GY45DRAFT_58435 [Cubamyces sp. BRFM 1775]|nr:hypothetical protein GY45DRAFT_58435 [Cubamyces sp. BRFM 1775]